MIWSVVPKGSYDTCGGCGRRMEGDEPKALISPKGLTRTLVRCVGCAGVPVNEHQVDLARHALESASARTEQQQQEFDDKNAALGDQVRTALGQSRGFVKASDAVGHLFDPKRAAAGDRE